MSTELNLGVGAMIRTTEHAHPLDGRDTPIHLTWEAVVRTRALDLHPTEVHGQPRATATGAGGSLPRRSRLIGTIITPWLGSVLVALGVGAAVGPLHAAADTATPPGEAAAQPPEDPTATPTVCMANMGAQPGTWMHDIDPCIRYRRLSDILIPGSHDSVTYNLKFPIAAGFAQTQNQTLEEQLNDGVRAFDIRVSYFTTGNFGANWYAQHGGIQDVTLTFGQIITSLGNWANVAGREQEIIMLNLSLQNNPDDPFPVNLCATIGEDWGKNLVTPDMLMQQLNTADPGEPIFDQLWRLPQSFRGARIIIDNLECLTHATGNVAQWGPISPPNTSFITAY
jgi:hypothetical protein